MWRSIAKALVVVRVKLLTFKIMENEKEKVARIVPEQKDIDVTQSESECVCTDRCQNIVNAKCKGIEIKYESGYVYKSSKHGASYSGPGGDLGARQRGVAARQSFLPLPQGGTRQNNPVVALWEDANEIITRFALDNIELKKEISSLRSALDKAEKERDEAHSSNANLTQRYIAAKAMMDQYFKDLTGALSENERLKKTIEWLEKEYQNKAH